MADSEGRIYQYIGEDGVPVAADSLEEIPKTLRHTAVSRTTRQADAQMHALVHAESTRQKREDHFDAAATAWAALAAVGLLGALAVLRAPVTQRARLGGIIALVVVGIGFMLWRHEPRPARDAINRAQGVLEVVIDGAKPTLEQARQTDLGQVKDQLNRLEHNLKERSEVLEAMQSGELADDPLAKSPDAVTP